MDDYTKISHKSYSLIKEEKEDKKVKYLRNLITRILLSLILIISLCIYMRLNEDNRLLVKEHLFLDSLEFTKINEWYQDKFGLLLPKTSDNSDMVFNNEELKTNNYTPYLDGVKISMPKSSPISSLKGGIVVFIGDKEGYDNTLIIQGNDGVDYWYGGLTNISVNLYDYLEKDTLLGESLNDYIYIVLQKDGQLLNYEEYIK